VYESPKSYAHIDFDPDPDPAPDPDFDSDADRDYPESLVGGDASLSYDGTVPTLPIGEET
jgi:hypothetical protein